MCRCVAMQVWCRRGRDEKQRRPPTSNLPARPCTTTLLVTPNDPQGGKLLRNIEAHLKANVHDPWKNQQWQRTGRGQRARSGSGGGTSGGMDESLQLLIRRLA